MTNFQYCISIFLLLCLAPGCKTAPQEIPEIGVQLWTFKEFTVEDALRKADSAGIRNIELFEGQQIRNGSIETVSAFMSDSSEYELIEMAKQYNLSIRSAYLAIPSDSDQWSTLFAFAKRLKLSYIVMEPPVEQLSFIDSMAVAKGVPIALHNHPKGQSYYSHPDTVAAVIHNRPGLGVCADVGHWGRSGLNPIDGLKKLNHRILGIHIKDIDEFGKKDAADIPAGKGILDFKVMLNVLKDSQFKGILVIEREGNWHNNTQEVKETADLLQLLWKEID